MYFYIFKSVSFDMYIYIYIYRVRLIMPVYSKLSKHYLNLSYFFIISFKIMSLCISSYMYKIYIIFPVKSKSIRFFKTCITKLCPSCVLLGCVYSWWKTLFYLVQLSLILLQTFVNCILFDTNVTKATARNMLHKQNRTKMIGMVVCFLYKYIRIMSWFLIYCNPAC